MLLASVLGAALGGCALGDDGVNRRDDDGGPVATFDAGRDAGEATDAWTPPIECEPRCDDTQTCVDGTCVSGVLDLDGDGVPAESDCDDMNASVGSSAERACDNSCGAGMERCTDGVWAECDAPASCECAAGSAPRTVACAQCGMQQQSCVDGTWTNTGSCTGMGACSPGAVESRTSSCGACGEGTRTETRTCSSSCAWGSFTPVGSCSTAATCTPGQTDSETRACSGGCGMTERRTRSCSSSSCTWGSFGSWSGCSPCGPVCGNGTCESGETCAACADCRYGHGGNGNGGDSCAGVPAETWRCVYSSSLGGNVSQVCRSGAWVNFNFDPRGCSSCRCSFSLSCCQAGYTGGGCG